MGGVEVIPHFQLNAGHHCYYQSDYLHGCVWKRGLLRKQLLKGQNDHKLGSLGPGTLFSDKRPKKKIWDTTTIDHQRIIKGHKDPPRPRRAGQAAHIWYLDATPREFSGPLCPNFVDIKSYHPNHISCIIVSCNGSGMS